MATHHHISHRHHRKIKKDPIDHIIYFFTFTTPLFELPQAYIIYTTKSAESVSIYTWVFFLFADIVWLIYAFHHRITPLIIMYILYLVVESFIVAGIIMYN